MALSLVSFFQKNVWLSSSFMLFFFFLFFVCRDISFFCFVLLISIGIVIIHFERNITVLLFQASNWVIWLQSNYFAVKFFVLFCFHCCVIQFYPIVQNSFFVFIILLNPINVFEASCCVICCFILKKNHELLDAQYLCKEILEN